MPAADFAAAQRRLHQRRQQRETALRAHQASLTAEREALTQRIPYPFRSLSLASLTLWDSIKGREGTYPSFRVGQVDAELLDEELLELLRGQVGEALKYYGTQLHSEHGAEILCILRAILFKLSVWDHDASYGASLQGLRYTDARDTSLSRPPPRRWQKSAYGLITVLGRYGWGKWEDYLAEAEGGYDEPSPTIRRLSNLTSRISTIHSIAALTSFLTFLYNGRYRTILDRLLRLRLVPSTAQTSREISFEYLNRQLVWHAFTEFLLFLLPLVGVSRWRRILSRSWRKMMIWFRRAFSSSSSSRGEEDDEDDIPKGELGFLPERTCAICYADQTPTGGGGGGGEAEVLAQTAGGGVIGSASTDVTNAYEALPCGHVFCFVCLAQKIEGEEGEGWTCLRCGEVVKECRPWSGDVLEETPRPSSSKSVGFSTSRVMVDNNGDEDSGYEDEKYDSSQHHNHQRRRAGFLGPAAEDESINGSLAEVEPMPTDDERTLDPSHGFISSTSLGFHSTDGEVDGLGMGESSEWARASREIEHGDESDERDGHEARNGENGYSSVVEQETETEEDTETGASTFDSEDEDEEDDDASEELDEEIEEMNGFD